MNRLLTSAALVVISTSVPAGDKQFLMTYDQSRFLTSIERVGPCKITSDPVSALRFSEQLYPKASVARGEEGTVIMEFVFDADWCIRKATIVKSTGFWRLDQVSLSYVMTVRFKPKPESIKVKDGEPTMVVKLGWGASQGKH